MTDKPAKMTFAVTARRISAHGSEATCKSASVVLDTDESDHRLALLHEDVGKYGTVYNAVELKRWMIEPVQRGVSPQALVALVAPMVAVGWDEQAAVYAVQSTMRTFLAEHSHKQGPSLATKLPAPSGLKGSAVVDAGDREVQVLARMLLPRLVWFGSLLADDECDELVSLSHERVGRSKTAAPRCWRGKNGWRPSGCANTATTERHDHWNTHSAAIPIPSPILGVRRGSTAQQPKEWI